MDLDTMLDEAAPARHVRLDGPDSPAAVSLYRQIVTQPPAAATARRRYRHLVAVSAIAGTCAVVAVAIIYGSQLRSNDVPAPQHGTAAAVLGQAALTAARQPTAAVPGPGQYVYVETIEGQRTKAPGSTTSGICRQTVRVWAAPDGSGREVASAPAGAACDGGGIPSQAFPKGQEIDYNVYPGAANLPTEPAALEQFIVRHFEYRPGHSGPGDIGATFDFAGTFLQSGAPPDIRAAIFRLIQKLPGIESLGPMTDRLGRHGIGVGFTQHGVRDVLIFDPATTAVLEREGIAVDPAQIDVPPGWARFSAGEVINYTVYKASGVVNSIGAVPSAAA
jgi:hypothetical protein